MQVWFRIENRIVVRLHRTIVPEYIWQEVNDKVTREKRKNTSKTVGLITLGALGLGAAIAYKRKRQLMQRHR